MSSCIYMLKITWPDPSKAYRARTRYLTRPGALAQAAKLEERGAEVEIVRSLPVQWPGGRII